MTRRYALLLLALVSGWMPATGCTKFRQSGRSLWRSLTPPRGEYFFDEKSHEIERHLRREAVSPAVFERREPADPPP